MATIRRTPPQPPKWQLEIDEDERQYLLAALDFAQAFLSPHQLWSDVKANWPHPPGHYTQKIARLEQIIASVNPQDLTDA